MSDVKLDTKGLDKLIKALKNAPVGRIGVLGKNDNRRGSESNASIGAKHEFGSGSLPVRSFLRMPLTDYLPKYLEESGAFDKKALASVVEQGSLKPWVEKIMIVAEEVVLDAFDTGGFGTWQPSIMEHKVNQQTLIETGQLRDSITSEVA